MAERYSIRRFLAVGGMGEVYEAEDLALQQTVALKTVRPTVVTDQMALERFKREIQTARQVTHPNVCRIYDLGSHRSDSAVAALYPNHEILFVTMELLQGESLAERLSSGPLEPAEGLAVTEQVAAALDAAHKAGIIHRDLKPANIMLEPSDDGDPRVVVTDFGLARGHSQTSSDHALTRDGALLGSPAYMAPEQLQGGEVTRSVDVYAFGITLFEMMTGSVPFQGDTPIDTAAKRLHEAPPAPSTLRADLDPLWEAVILRCLERDPSARFESAGEVSAALRGEEEAVALSSRPLFKAVAAGFLLALAIVANYWMWSRRGADDALSVFSPPEAARSAVALMGFRNVTGNEEHGWLSAGLAEMLRSEISVGDLVRVIPGENVVRAKLELGLEDGDTFSAETLTTLRQSLGADYVVGGSYTALPTASTEQLRLDIRLQRADGAEDASSVRVAGVTDEIFALVAEAGKELRAALKLGDRERESELRLLNAEVAKLYAEGLERLRRYDAEGARELLEQAAASDPENPEIRSALAKAYAGLGYVLRAQEEARVAMSLSTPLDEADQLEIRGQYFQISGQLLEALEVYEELFLAFPDNLEYGLELAEILTTVGDAAGALQVTETLRLLPSAAAGDARIAYVEASASGVLGDFRKQREAAAEGAAASREQGARLLLARGLLLEAGASRNLGDVVRAETLTIEAERLFADAGDTTGVARARVQRGSLFLDQGQLEQAGLAFEEAIETYRQLGDKGNEAQATNNLAVVLARQGQTESALELYTAAGRLARETGNRAGVTHAENNIGVLLARFGQLGSAATRFENAIEVSRELGDRSQEAYSQFNLGSVERRRGRLDAAQQHLESSLEARRSMGQRPGEAASMTSLGRLALYYGALDRASSLFTEALELSSSTGNRRFEAASRFGLAEVQRLQGDLTGALEAHQKVLELARDGGESAALAESRLAVARTALSLANPSHAVTAGVESLRAIEELEREGAIDPLAHAQAMRALALVRIGRPGESQALAAAALERAGATEDVYLAADIRLLVARVYSEIGQRDVGQTVLTEASRIAASNLLLPLELEALMVEAQVTRDSGHQDRAVALRQLARERAGAAGLENFVASFH